MVCTMSRPFWFFRVMPYINPFCAALLFRAHLYHDFCALAIFVARYDIEYGR